MRLLPILLCLTATAALVAQPAAPSAPSAQSPTPRVGVLAAERVIERSSRARMLFSELDTLKKTIPERTLDAVDIVRRTLMAGFTTVRDVGSGDYIDVGLRNAIAAGKIPGPRMLVAVHALGATGGHCDSSAGFAPNIFGRETGITDGVINGPDEARQAVRYNIKYGADVIKTCATGGVLSLTDDVDTPQLTQAELDAIVAEAHNLRRKTAAHAHGAPGAKIAIRAGIDSIEHGTFLDEEALDMMQAMNTGHDGSLTTIHANTPRDGLGRLEVMVGMANSNMGIRSVRQQISSAVDLFIQTSRFSDGSRRVTHITEVIGMEQEIITLQDIFLFEKTGLAESGKVMGRFRATGIRPKFYERLKSCGIVLPTQMFQTVVEIH